MSDKSICALIALVLATISMVSASGGNQKKKKDVLCKHPSICYTLSEQKTIVTGQAIRGQKIKSLRGKHKRYKIHIAQIHAAKIRQKVNKINELERKIDRLVKLKIKVCSCSFEIITTGLVLTGVCGATHLVSLP